MESPTAPWSEFAIKPSASILLLVKGVPAHGCDGQAAITSYSSPSDSHVSQSMIIMHVGHFAREIEPLVAWASGPGRAFLHHYLDPYIASVPNRRSADPKQASQEGISVMTQLNLIQLACTRTEDSGEDEVYIKINGWRAWPDSGAAPIGPHQMVPITRTFSFDHDSMSIELVDEDTEPIDPDDSLGTHTARESQKGLGVMQAIFEGNGCHYRLTYSVT
ncbi:hypothetical protein ACIBKY_53120 [Nonomuraea sp. NPDC050394]|uniref:hypothetical protein n=1 Tax=Nonomuraea sp. NPDC050394 TaxID=3364363 RepID=UPI0037B483D3